MCWWFFEWERVVIDILECEVVTYLGMIRLRKSVPCCHVTGNGTTRACCVFAVVSPSFKQEGKMANPDWNYHRGWEAAPTLLSVPNLLSVLV